MSSVELKDLQRILSHLQRARFEMHLEKADQKSVVKVIGCIGSTLEETKVRIDPNHHMLRTTEAKALGGYLRAKYRSRAKVVGIEVKRKGVAKKKDAARASIDVRADLVSIGEKPTVQTVAAATEMDEDYQKCVAAELVAQEDEVVAQELADLFDELRSALADRHEVMVEISRNDRAIIKGKEEQ